MLLLLVLSCLGASSAWAQGQSLGLTVAPVGAFMLTGTPKGRLIGYAAEVGWVYRRADALAEVGGHVATSQLLTTATPLAVRFTPLRDSWVRPYLGLGASLLVPHVPSAVRPVTSPSSLLVGAEVSGGVGVELRQGFFLATEARYQSFSTGGDPLSGERQALGSAFVGLGLHL
ncbi:hypothetical protein [Hyalangium versicolor]|uniref:hypothetical protein n=1 Tax=Hyalangium versicolor TaxID=2861190 RepID=UPI001CC94C2A|nr:hypothetical protein [Hyalangium versicolor]